MTTGRINQVTTIRDLSLLKTPSLQRPRVSAGPLQLVVFSDRLDARQTSSVDDLRGNSFPRPN